MGTNLPAENTSTEEATVVISHRVCQDKHVEYDRWLEEIVPLAKAANGLLDWHIVRPIPGRSETFRVILRFETDGHLKDWMNSETRTRLIEKVRPLLLTGDDFFISSGLDFWFTPEGSDAPVPVRWKQYVVTWSAIYPLVLGVTFLATSVLTFFGIAPNHYLFTLLVTATVVFLMVYVVMPRYTRLISRWLYN